MKVMKILPIHFVANDYWFQYLFVAVVDVVDVLEIGIVVVVGDIVAVADAVADRY